MIKYDYTIMEHPDYVKMCIATRETYDNLVKAGWSEIEESFEVRMRKSDKVNKKDYGTE